MSRSFNSMAYKFSFGYWAHNIDTDKSCKEIRCLGLSYPCGAHGGAAQAGTVKALSSASSLGFA